MLVLNAVIWSFFAAGVASRNEFDCPDFRVQSCQILARPRDRHRLTTLFLLDPEKLIIVLCNLSKALGQSVVSGLSRGMKRKYKPMGAAHSSGSAVNKKFMSDTQPSDSLPQGDVSSFESIASQSVRVEQ